jgi:hypothetical protein
MNTHESNHIMIKHPDPILFSWMITSRLVSLLLLLLIIIIIIIISPHAVPNVQRVGFLDNSLVGDSRGSSLVLSIIHPALLDSHLHHHHTSRLIWSSPLTTTDLKPSQVESRSNLLTRIQEPSLRVDVAAVVESRVEEHHMDIYIYISEERSGDG